MCEPIEKFIIIIWKTTYVREVSQMLVHIIEYEQLSS